MAVALKYINLIIPRTVIEEKYPGGWQKCLADFKHMIGGRAWFEDGVQNSPPKRP